MGNNEKIINLLSQYPKLYEESTISLWNDDNISKYMLDAHLRQDVDAASRPMDFITSSVKWIDSIVSSGKCLLDLGCGPGLYTTEFAKLGYCVTGVDFSQRSIDYATKQANANQLNINYIYSDYLKVNFEQQFDVITLIYCDFGVLSNNDRKQLLTKIYSLLKTNGIFVCDVWSFEKLKDFDQINSTKYYEKGFFANEPHVLISRSKYYEQTHNTLDQYIIVRKDRVDCINNWNQLYTKESIIDELTLSGFNKSSISFFADALGKDFSEKSTTICFVARK